VVSPVLASQGLVVVRIGVADVRSIDPLDVRDDPWPQDIPESQHPRNAAHALIVGWAGLSKKIERQRALTRLPSLEFV
jgi:hypothetical protein